MSLTFRDSLKNTMTTNDNNMASWNPLITVVIPAYNAEFYLSRTLDSILSQTYENLEILVIDDGSQDQHSGQFCRNVGEKLSTA